MSSPTSGGPERCVARTRSNESGSAGRRRSGIVGCSTLWRKPSAVVCSEATTSATSATGAAGTPAAVRRSCQSAVSRSAEPRRHEPDQRLPVPHAIGVRPEALVRDELGQLERLAEPAEEPIVSAGDHQLAVAGGEDLVGRDHRERRSLPGRHRPVREVADEVVADVAEGGLVEG